MRDHQRTACVLWCISLLHTLLLHRACAANVSHPNVLFIVVEDLRTEPWFGPDPNDPAGTHTLTPTLTPNIHRLAQRGATFLRAYCQVTICAPSRASLLTGLRPDTLGIYDFSHYGGTRYFRSIPSHLHRSGYQTSMSGKLQHWDSHRYYSAHYWGHPMWDVVQRQESRWQNSSVTPDTFHEPTSSMFRDAHVVKHALRAMRDMEGRRVAAARAADALRANAETNSNPNPNNPNPDAFEPWFLAVGFKGTHMPYHMPRRFHDLFANTTFVLPSEGGLRAGRRADQPELIFPSDAPLLAHVRKTEQTHIVYGARLRSGQTYGTHREYYQKAGDEAGLGAGGDEGGRVRGGVGVRVSKEGWTELYRGYLACLAYTDFLIGKLLDALDTGFDLTHDPNSTTPTPNLWSSTIVVLTSDHGMHVGEKGIWGKWTLFEESTHVPLIIALPSTTHRPNPNPFPGLKSGRYAGLAVSRPVELIDVFPTLVEATGTGAVLASPCPVLVREREETTSDPISDPNPDPDAVGPVYRIVKGGPRLPVVGEGPVRNAEGHIFRHVYCDRLDGRSLVGDIRTAAAAADATHGNGDGNRNVGSSSEPSAIGGGIGPFAVTQKMTCKLPPAQPRRTAKWAAQSTTTPYLDIDPATPLWIDFCPSKRLPRDPPLGAMGYAVTAADWKYIAWLPWNTSSFLPLLHRPPLAEELYDLSPPHPRSQNEDGTSPGPNHYYNLYPAWPPKPNPNPNPTPLVIRSYARELHNLAHTNPYPKNDNTSAVLAHMRLGLYDFLCASRHPHLFYVRLDDRKKNIALIEGRPQAVRPFEGAGHYYKKPARAPGLTRVE